MLVLKRQNNMCGYIMYTQTQQKVITATVK